MPARRQSTSHSSASGPLRAARRMALLLLSGLSIESVAPAITMAQDAPIVRPSLRAPYADHIAEASRRFGVPVAWIRAVMRAESAGDPHAISRKGAMGLMQIMPETWAGLRLRHHLGADPYDPHDNIIAGAGYIRELFDRYGSPGWIAAYNAGPGRYRDSLRGRALPAETRAYVAIVAPSADGGDTASPMMIVTADPLAWTHAPLFIAQPDRRPAVDPVPVERASDAATMTPAVRDVSAIVPQSGGLFVARAGEGTAR
ncbi:lytic transglycosylase domain-containing protein [Mesorhizobium sp. B1-1-8]|uniref:lytic transglycosylase domain-containing protein n=1 Tax=Mesorhizobium sp. B1-1-8 TaxID=2589976 RepID=UPI001128E1ED|nr:lytic transglycosylase domain-containing protein [Mesorhizobium sp. B1-1-8]UCI05216.1 lytic transglycosylase domain-containing protein [Mesorhizobium sp. B1-1-8]